MKISVSLIILMIFQPSVNDELQTCILLSADNIFIERTLDTVIGKDSTFMIIHEVTQEVINVSSDSYAIQLGAFTQKSNAEKMKVSLHEILDKDVKIVIENDFYKIRIFELKNRKEVNKILNILSQHNFTEFWVIKFKTKQQQHILADSQHEKLARVVVGDREVRFPGLRTMISGNTIQGTKTVVIDNANPWLRRFDYFGKSITLIAFLIVIIIISITTMVILLVVILLNRRRMEKKEKLYQYLLENYQQLIIDYIYGESDPEMFKRIASDRYRRQVLIDQMIDVAINLKGDSWEKLRNLYLELELEKDSINKAYNKRWHIKIKGFRELAFMNIKEANNEILKCLNSHNEILRMEAQIALVRLGEDNPFRFLHHIKRPFSLWEQITLHELIVQHSIKIPLFSEWIDSPNDTVVLFALRMIREFKQSETEKDVTRALSHPHSDVRNLAIQVAGDLKMESTRKVLKHMYKHEDYNNSLTILKAIGKMPDKSLIGFLKLVIDKEEDVQLQIEATKAIENVGEEGVKELVKMMKSEYKNYNIIIRHVLDRRIY